MPLDCLLDANDFAAVLKSIERDEAARKTARLEKAKQSEPVTKASPEPPVEEETETEKAGTTPAKTRTSSLGNFF